MVRIKMASFTMGIWLFGVATTVATPFGIVSGIVQDEQHRPVPRTDVSLRARLSSWQEHLQTDADGKTAR